MKSANILALTIPILWAALGFSAEVKQVVVKCDAAYYKAHEVHKIFSKENVGENYDVEDLQLSFRKDGLEDGTVRFDDNGVPYIATLSLESEKLSLRYFFNSENGGIEINDHLSGKSIEQIWFKQEGELNGYVDLYSTEITDRNGGLLGDPKIYKIDVSCSAKGL